MTKSPPSPSPVIASPAPFPLVIANPAPFPLVIARSGTTKQSIDSAFAINILQMDHRVGIKPSS